MAFRLEDFKKTSRKAASGSNVPASVYPHQIKDKKAVARLEIAIRTFDALVGKRRGEMNPQTMVDFFGDPRLARGIVACLGQYYKYQTPRFADIVETDGAQRLGEANLATPMALRAHTYAHVNARHGGFLAESQRAACYAELAAPFCLSAHLWDSLLHLDAEENQVLTRPGAAPTPADIVALYNFHALDTCLRRAEKIVLNGLSLSASEASDVRALAKALGVKVVISGEGRTVTFSDLEMSSLLPRRPGRLARCMLHLAHAYATRATTGYADTRLGTRSLRLTFSTETFKRLVASLAVTPHSFTFRKQFEAADALHKAMLKQRAQGEAAGWRFQRRPEPVVSAQGILLPDLTLTQGDRRVSIVFSDATQKEWETPVLALPLGRKPNDPAAVLTQAAALTDNLFALPNTIPPAIPGDVRALFERAATHGLVCTADAQRTLHLLDESPLIEWVRQAADPRVRFIPGVGLLSQELAAAIAQ
nr:DUF790 family protein [Armatimonadota bacterium]